MKTISTYAFLWESCNGNAYFEAHKSLGVGMKIVGDFLETCREFPFINRSLQGMDVLSMCHCIAGRGKGWRTPVYNDGKRCAIHTAILPAVFKGPARFPREACECGACNSCSDRGRRAMEAQKLLYYTKLIVACHVQCTTAVQYWQIHDFVSNALLRDFGW